MPKPKKDSENLASLSSFPKYWTSTGMRRLQKTHWFVKNHWCHPTLTPPIMYQWRTFDICENHWHPGERERERAWLRRTTVTNLAFPFRTLALLFSAAPPLTAWLWMDQLSRSCSSSPTNNSHHLTIKRLHTPILVLRQSRSRHGCSFNSWESAALLLLLLLLLTPLISMAAMASLTPAMWLPSSSAAAAAANRQQQGEGLRLYRVRTTRVASFPTIAKCGRDHLGHTRATTLCAAFDESGKNGRGGVESAAMPIQFENGQDPPTVVYAPNRRIVASK